MQPDVLYPPMTLFHYYQRVMISHLGYLLFTYNFEHGNNNLGSLVLGPKRAAVGRWANQYHGSYATHDRTIFDFY